MLSKLFVFTVIFTSLGVFIKLIKHGAPVSSFLYSLSLPAGVLIISLSYGYNKIKREKDFMELSFFQKFKVYMLFTYKCIKSLPLLTGIMCVELGKRKIGIIEMLDGGIIAITKHNLKRLFKFFSDNIMRYNIEMYNSKNILRMIQ